MPMAISANRSLDIKSQSNRHLHLLCFHDKLLALCSAFISPTTQDRKVVSEIDTHLPKKTPYPNLPLKTKGKSCVTPLRY